MAKTSPFLGKLKVLPPNVPFVQLTYELINSVSWRVMSIPCRRLIDFLLLEHMSHGGMENGNLIATYNQLEGFGIARSSISKIIQEAEHLGLIRVEHGMRSSRNKNYLNRFELTFMPATYNTDNGVKMYAEPTNDWRKVTDDDAKRITGRTPRRLYADGPD